MKRPGAQGAQVYQVLFAGYLSGREGAPSRETWRWSDEESRYSDDADEVCEGE